MIKYDVAIPTRGRVGEIYTVALFKHLKSVRDIHLFIADADEYRAIKSKHNRDTKVFVHRVRCEQGVVPIKNHIKNFFEEGKKFIMADDDIVSFHKINSIGNKLFKMTYEEIDDFIQTGFHLLEKHKTKMFGLYPVANGFFMKNRINPFGFICGLMIGFINDKSIMIDKNLQTKMDYDLTIKHILKYKKVIRFDNITFKTKSKPKTGCKAYRNDEVRIKDAEYLANKYPRYVRLNTKRVGEILLTFRGEK